MDLRPFHFRVMIHYFLIGFQAYFGAICVSYYAKIGIENLNGKEHGQFEKKFKLGAQNFVLNFKLLEELLPSNYKLDESR